jgi:hypothetical protein
VTVSVECPSLWQNSEMKGMSGPICREVNPTIFRIATRVLEGGGELTEGSRVGQATLLPERGERQWGRIRNYARIFCPSRSWKNWENGRTI